MKRPVLAISLSPRFSGREEESVIVFLRDDPSLIGESNHLGTNVIKPTIRNAEARKILTECLRNVRVIRFLHENAHKVQGTMRRLSKRLICLVCEGVGKLRSAR